MKRIMVSLVIVLLGLPCASSAEEWEHNNSPIRNFSFEIYSQETGSFDNWVYGNEETMHPEDFGQDLAYSLHYSASAYIKETTIGEGHESCYLQAGILVSHANDWFKEKPCYLVAFIKCKNVESTNGGGAFAEISFPPGDIVVTYTSQMLTGDHNWCKLIVPFTFPPFGGRFDVRVGLKDATGEVWMDYVQIVQMDTFPEEGVFTNLDNPSFDCSADNFNGWDENPGDDTTITADANISMNGPYSAKFYFDVVSPPSNRTSYLYQNINTTTGPYTYCASAFVQTGSLQYEQSPLHPGAKIHVLYEDKLDWYSQSVNGTNTWIKIQGIFDKPRGTSDSLELRLETLASSGTAWFDWVALKLNPIQNPHFNDWSPTGEPNLFVWDIEGDGDGGYSTDYFKSSPSCGRIYNNYTDYDTVLRQLFCLDIAPSLREGATYLLSGWVKTISVVPDVAGPVEAGIPNGAFVEVGVWQDNDFITLARSECLTGTNDWQKFSLWFSLPLDYFMTENDGITTFDDFMIYCRLHKASGSAYFDDVNITELEYTEDVATVVPQPQAVEYRGYHSDPLAGFLITNGGPYTTTIYYTPDALPHVELGDTYYFSAENLRQELNRAFYECQGDDYDYDNTGWEGIKYDYPIEDNKVVALDSNFISSELNKPCIVLGDPDRDLSVNHLFQAELEKRGIVLPEDFNPEGYIMDIGEDIILIAASDQDGAGLTKGAGSFYGTQTLLQLLDIEHRVDRVVMGETFHRNTVVAPACYIYDFPDMEWRGQMTIIGHWLEDEETDDYPGWRLYKETGFRADTDNDVIRNQKLFAKKMANFKMNRLSAYSMVFFFLEYDVLPPVGGQQVPYDKNYEYLESLFDYCRKLHIEPIPMMGDYYFALLRHNGNCLEYMIYDSEYIDDNNLRPGQVDYYDPVPDQNTYPVPMPQPSWEFKIDDRQVQHYYFEEHEVNVWDEDVGNGGGPGYELKSTLAYRVCNREEDGENVYPIRVEEKVDGDWVELVEDEDYDLHNVGLNTTMGEGADQIGTSYLRIRPSGFYGYEGDERAYITFTDLEVGTEVRVSYAAPIKWSYIYTNWEELAYPHQLAYWTCMSYFDDDGDDILYNDIPGVSSYSDLSEEGFDNTGAWTSWDGRDIWYVALYQMINRLKPRYIDIQHCEQFFMHTDDRCQVERKHGVRDDYCEDEQYPHRLLSKYHNAFILGKEIDWMRRAMEEIDGEEGTDTRLMMFGDQFNSHNGTYFEGRCWWDWYDEEVDPYHQPDIDDENWEGDELSHVYYQPAMGGMGGWTWDSSQIKNPLLMASTYIGGKDDLVIAEWGYQSGIFDDREGFEYIEWRDKYELRYDELIDQGFTDFVGMCAGYAFESEQWQRLRLECEDYTEEEIVYYSSFERIDGTNLNWVQISGEMEKAAQEEIDIGLFFKTYTQDPSGGGAHLDGEGKGYHAGTVQDGFAYMDDVEVKNNETPLPILNKSFEFGLSGWEPFGPDYITWEQSDEESHGGMHSCKLEIDRTGYYYNTVGTYINQDYYEALQSQTVNLDFSVYVKTIKLDALRHLNPKIWTDLTDEYYQEDEILGMMSTFCGHCNRTLSTETSSADWMWSLEYPPSPFLNWMYYDPYFLFDNYGHYFEEYDLEPYYDSPYPKDYEEELAELE